MAALWRGRMLGSSHSSFSGFKSHTRCFTSVGNGVAAPRMGLRTTQQVVVVAAKPTKAAELRNMSDEELLTGVGRLNKELAMARFRAKTRGRDLDPRKWQEEVAPDAVPKASVFRHTRRQVAQMLTILRERQIKQGVNKRQARKLKKRALVQAGFGKFAR